MQDKNQADIITLTAEELNQQLTTVLNFLRIVHPSLVSDEPRKPCVEIRPITRGDKDYQLSRPCNIWDLSEKSIARVRSFLEKHNGAPTCLFYSVFTYDNNMKTMTKSGKLAKTGHITTASAIDTSEIVLDFDRIGYEEYTQLVDRFEDMGLYALWAFTGHGYHAHLLLDKALADKNILLHLVYKFRAKGFDCDSTCVDPARVMRLPGTYNKKYLKYDTYATDRDAPPRCDIIQDSTERYAVEYIHEVLDKLPTVSLEDEEFYMSKLAQSGQSSSNPESNEVSSGESMDVLAKIEYPYISNYDLPEAIQKMLAYTPEGYRNKSLGFLIKFFKTHLKLGRTQISEILALWSTSACNPVYEPKEFKDDFGRLYYNYNGLSYTPDMVRQFGPIDTERLIQLRKQDISVPNKLFRSFAKLDGTEVRLYLGIKMLEHQGSSATQASLSELLNISTRALRPTIQSLEKSGFVYRVDGNRRQGIPFSYRTSHIISKRDGFMTFSYNDIKAYVTELYDEGSRANGALKLFLFFQYKFFEGEIYMSQRTLGENLGFDQSAISKMVDKLEELHFIKVEKVRKSFMESNVYTLLR